MIDLGIDKLALIGAVALIVIGPEKLPKVARTVGNLLGRAQRYVAEVKAEVNRSMELDELRKTGQQFNDHVRDFQNNIHSEWDKTRQDIHQSWTGEALSAPSDAEHATTPNTPIWDAPREVYRSRQRKNWRMKRAHIPVWYRQQQGLKSRIRSAASQSLQRRSSTHHSSDLK